jgi:hypothetical protein
MGQAPVAPLPGGFVVLGTGGFQIARDNLVALGPGYKKEVMELMFPPGVYQNVSLGRLSVDLSVSPATSRTPYRIYIALHFEFIRTEQYCMCCNAHITLHCPPQEGEDKKRFRCPPHLASEANLAILREQMATWLEGRVGAGYFLPVCLDPLWDSRNQYRQDTYEVLAILPRDEGLYSLFAPFIGIAKNSLLLNTPSYYQPEFHIRVKELEYVGRAPSGAPDDGFWRAGAGRQRERGAIPGQYSRSWSCP